MTEGKEDECDAGGGDFIVPAPVVIGGRQLAFRHREDHVMEVGTIGPVEDGIPLPDDARMVEQGQDGRLHLTSTVGEMKKGPAKVSSPSYRSGWDRVFGSKPTVGQA